MAYTDSAIELDSLNVKSDGISQNIFSHIQVQSTSETPITARPFRIKNGSKNKFEFIHTWSDGSIEIPAISIEPSENLANSYDLRNNVFEGVIEGSIEGSDEAIGMNDFSKIQTNRWIDKKFNGAVGSLHGEMVTHAQNILASDLVYVARNEGKLPVFQYAPPITGQTAHVDSIGHYMQIDVKAGSGVKFYYPLSLVHSELVNIKTIPHVTLGFDFSLAVKEDISKYIIEATLLYFSSSDGTTFIPKTHLIQASQSPDGVYRFMQSVDNSTKVDDKYDGAYIRLNLGGTTSLKLRKVFLINEFVSINKPIVESHAASKYTMWLAAGSSTNNLSDIGIKQLPTNTATALPFTSKLLSKTTLDDQSMYIEYPIYS